MKLIEPTFHLPLTRDLTYCRHVANYSHLYFTYQTGFAHYKIDNPPGLLTSKFNDLSLYTYFELLNKLVCLCGSTDGHYILPQLHIKRNYGEIGYDELTYCVNEYYDDVDLDYISILNSFYEEVTYSMPRSIYTSETSQGDDCFDRYGMKTNQFPYQKACMYMAIAIYNKTTTEKDIKIYSGPFFTRGLMTPHIELGKMMTSSSNSSIIQQFHFIFLMQTVFYKHWVFAFQNKTKPSIQIPPCQGYHFIKNGNGFFSVICICEGGGNDTTCYDIKQHYKSSKKICAFNGKGDPSMFFKDKCSFEIHVVGGSTHHRLSSVDQCDDLSQTFTDAGNKCEIFDEFGSNLIPPSFKLTYCCNEDLCNFYEYHNDIVDGESFEIECTYSRSYAAKQSYSCAFAMLQVNGSMKLMLANRFHDLRSQLADLHKIKLGVYTFFDYNSDITVAESGIILVDKKKDKDCVETLDPEKYYRYVLIGCGTTNCDEELHIHMNTSRFIEAFDQVINSFTCDVGSLFIHPKAEPKIVPMPGVACMLTVIIDPESGMVTATIRLSDLKSDLTENNYCDVGFEQESDILHQCWYFAGKTLENVNTLIDALLVKKKKDDEASLKKETATYPDACELKGLRTYKRRKTCRPGNKGCFIVTNAMKLTGQIKNMEDGEQPATDTVYESCIGELEERIKDDDYVEELTDALLCNSKDTIDECFFANRGSKYSLVCCCTTQQLDLKPTFTGQISLYRCNKPVESQFQQFDKRLKRIREFQDKIKSQEMPVIDNDYQDEEDEEEDDKH